VTRCSYIRDNSHGCLRLPIRQSHVIRDPTLIWALRPQYYRRKHLKPCGCCDTQIHVWLPRRSVPPTEAIISPAHPDSSTWSLWLCRILAPPLENTDHDLDLDTDLCPARLLKHWALFLLFPFARQCRFQYGAEPVPVPSDNSSDFFDHDQQSTYVIEPCLAPSRTHSLHYQ
jgi:hypothetical protein